MSVSLCGQEIQVRSQFQRPALDNTGNTWAVDLPSDPAWRPREILSPGLPRNGRVTWFLTVHIPANQAFGLYLGENPENAVRSSFYRLLPDDKGIPDILEPVSMPLRESGSPQERWLTLVWDVAVPKDAPVERIKLEPQFWVADNWYTYPMEPRILSLVLPDVGLPKPAAKGAAMPAAAERADATERAVWRNTFCASPAGAAGAALPLLSLRALAERNARQFALWLKGMPADEADRVLGISNFCTYLLEETPKESAEWPLRLRDMLARRASQN